LEYVIEKRNETKSKVNNFIITQDYDKSKSIESLGLVFYNSHPDSTKYRQYRHVE
jgi:hypothetical protein